MKFKGNPCRDKAVLLAAALILALFTPYILRNDFYLRLANQALINIIAVLGLNFIAGLVGQMNMGSAGMFAIGAYTAALLNTSLGLSMWIGLAATIPMGILIGWLLSIPCSKVSGIFLALTTLSFGEIVRNLLSNLDFTGSSTGIWGIQGFRLFGLQISSNRSFFYFLLVIVSIMALIANRVIHSKWGRTFKAIKSSQTAVSTCGINVPAMKVQAFTLSAVYLCIGGALYASMSGFIFPGDFTGDMSVRFLMMMLIGGVGTVGGSILGAVTVTIIPELLRFLEEYYWLVFSVFTLLTAIFLPQGLYSLIRQAWAQAQRRFHQKKGAA